MKVYHAHNHAGLLAETADDLREQGHLATFATLTAMEQVYYAYNYSGQKKWWDTALCDYVVMM